MTILQLENMVPTPTRQTLRRRTGSITWSSPSRLPHGSSSYPSSRFMRVKQKIIVNQKNNQQKHSDPQKGNQKNNNESKMSAKPKIIVNRKCQWSPYWARSRRPIYLVRPHELHHSFSLFVLVLHVACARRVIISFLFIFGLYSIVLFLFNFLM